ncbi:helix-turn-helix domain-containing protein [Patulibacter sp. SYSU D01012]|uniref:winged helix-turn-helix transcriptional regulator n=1 Tax=Patulibacter sp. SYSU D01012 TaxID=2817381 RepID=UPI001B30FB8D|nr:helix-turn-helix domain-containing protein [Patulibacter sp. SYSU D01012]
MDATITMSGPLEPRDGWSADPCTIAAALETLGKRSTLLLLREAFYGATRFEEFVRRVGLSEPSVAARLRELVAAGLLAHVDYRDPGQRTRRGYRLTEKGADAFPVLAALMRWGDRWATEDGRGPVAFRHEGCGAPVGVAVRCADGHDVGPGELELTVAPRR